MSATRHQAEPAAGAVHGAGTIRKVGSSALARGHRGRRGQLPPNARRGSRGLPLGGERPEVAPVDPVDPGEVGGQVRMRIIPLALRQTIRRIL